MISSCPCRRAQAGPGSEAPSLVAACCAAIAGLPYQVFPVLQQLSAAASCPGAVTDLVLCGFGGQADYISVLDVF